MKALLLAAWALGAPFLSAEPRLRCDSFSPYRVHRAWVEDTDGFSGPLVVDGILWDGTRVPLFRGQTDTRDQSTEVAFYLDEEIRRLEVRMTQEGRSFSVDLATTSATNGGGPQEADERIRMRRMDPPIPMAPQGAAPARFSLAGVDLVMAGIQASTTLFRTRAAWLPVGLLAGFAGAVVGLAALRERPRMVWGLSAALAMGTGLALLQLGKPRPVLFTVPFQESRPGARISGMLDRQTMDLPSYTLITYTSEQGPRHPGALELVGVWNPGRPGIPLADVVPNQALVCFSSPPVITSAEGEWWIGSPELVTGWVVHD